ncbi:MAG: hypothetical protein JWN07_739 [Hyphomicrobiales bacterium]|nr:hypothetical protein [Hyphomicrobiales bacterium]
MRLLAASLGLVLIAPVASAAEPATYLGMIDAGSSASRLQVFRLSPDGATISDVLELAVETAPLASGASNAATAGDVAIRPLLGALDHALAQQGISKASVDIHLMATGGMRLLAAPSARAIEASVRRTIAESGYRPGRVETISGEMEGFYAWLDVNVLLGRLAPGQAPVGIVEIGGASMQVAYAGAPASDPGVVTASYGGATYSVRSVSLLGLGAEQARKSVLAGADAGACYPSGLAGDNGLSGAFDGARCTGAFATIVSAPAKALPRAEIGDVRFIGLGRPLTGVLADWRLAQDNPAAMKDAAYAQCRLPWDEFNRAHGDTRYTPHLCANSLYLATLLFDDAGFGLDANKVVAAETLAGRRPSWTRGAALMLRN